LGTSPGVSSEVKLLASGVARVENFTQEDEGFPEARQAKVLACTFSFGSPTSYLGTSPEIVKSSTGAKYISL